MKALRSYVWQNRNCSGFLLFRNIGGRIQKWAMRFRINFPFRSPLFLRIKQSCWLPCSEALRLLMASWHSITLNRPCAVAKRREEQAVERSGVAGCGGDEAMR